MTEIKDDRWRSPEGWTRQELYESGIPYSPEASDYSRFGDWQTKVVVAVMLLLATLLALAVAGCSEAFITKPDHTCVAGQRYTAGPHAGECWRP